MIAQDDHARLSGEVSRHFADHYFVDDTYIPALLTAIDEHDRGWIPLDESPFWNDRSAAPFTFMDYPLSVKLKYYQSGLDEVQAMNDYAAYLCSKHYCSFMTGSMGQRGDVQAFLAVERERQRQIQIRGELPRERDTIQRHFGLLQLCDDISLYVCLNKPGATKDEEHPWYAGGFAKSESLTPDGSGKLVASWLGEKEIAMRPMPFRSGFTANLRLKRVARQLIEQEGLQEAYRLTGWTEQEINFVGDRE